MAVGIKKRERAVVGGRNRKPRAPTFATEDAANAYAKAEGFKKYTLKNLKSTDSKDKKIRVVAQ